jgi:hypothetical protein
MLVSVRPARTNRNQKIMYLALAVKGLVARCKLNFAQPLMGRRTRISCVRFLVRHRIVAPFETMHIEQCETGWVIKSVQLEPEPKADRPLVELVWTGRVWS